MLFTFNVSRHSNIEELVTFEADRESEALKQAMWYHDTVLWDDGRNHSRLIMRRADLVRDLRLSARLARQDLDVVGLYRRL